MELNSAISRHLIYRAIYILTQLAAPGVRRGINPPARPGDYRRGHQRYRHQIPRGRQRRIPENSAARLPERNFQDMLENRLPDERPDRHPAAGYGSEPHLDSIVTDLDGMLARLCG